MTFQRGRAAQNDTSFERTAEFLRRGLESIADSVRPVDGGCVVLTPSLPRVWSLNQLRLSMPIPWTRVLELAEDHLATVPFRHLVADGDQIGRALEQPLRREGFRVDREVVMAAADKPRKHAHSAPVIEPDEQAMRAVERRWFEEDGRVPHPDIEQLLEAARREQRVWRERHFGIAGDDGAVVAITKLRSEGDTAQVEDVYTAPEWRGRGFASTLVGHALRVARQQGDELVFIVADDQDWPKHLYARLGFIPVGRRWAFHKQLG